MSKLDIYNIADAGVNVDSNPVQLEDNELTKAQNCIRDPLGSGGSVRKRPGLTPINGVAAAGAITGLIGVPIGLGTAGNGANAPIVPPIDPDTRSYVMARRIGTTTSGWNTSTDGFSTSPTTGGPDGYDANATPRVPDYLWAGEVNDTTHHKYRNTYSGRPSCTFNNRIYYAGNDYTPLSSTSTPTIRMWDGTTDFLIGRLPESARAIMCMIVGGNQLIYFTVMDSGEFNNNTMIVRCFQLDPDDGRITQIGTTFPLSPESVRVPFDLAWHQDKLWTRTHGGGTTATSQIVYYIRPEIDSTWTAETSDSATQSCNLLFNYQGKLYMGIVTDLGTAAYIQSRSSLGVYATAKTALLNEGTTMASFGFHNSFGAAGVFGGNLYVSYWNQEGASGNNTGDLYARIYKFDGTTWTVAYGPVANHADCVPYTDCRVFGSKIFFVSAPARTSSNAINRLLYSSNGSSWTAVTGTLLDNDSGGFLGAISS